MKMNIDKKKKIEANKLLAKVMERARTAIYQINSDSPVEFFIGMGDVHELCRDASVVKNYLKETREQQSDTKTRN